jgi:hypothetical protein
MVTLDEVDIKDRIRSCSDPDVNARIDKEINIRLQWYATKSKGEIRQRLSELDTEPSVESVLESRASLLAMTGAVFGTKPGHELIAKLRKLGVRSRAEIDRERRTLSASMDRGDVATDRHQRLPS